MWCWPSTIGLKCCERTLDRSVANAPCMYLLVSLRHRLWLRVILVEFQLLGRLSADARDMSGGVFSGDFCAEDLKSVYVCVL